MRSSPPDGVVFTLYVGAVTFIHALETSTATAVCIVFMNKDGTVPTTWASSAEDDADGTARPVASRPRTPGRWRCLPTEARSSR